MPFQLLHQVQTTSYYFKFLVSKLGAPHSFTKNDVAELNRLDLILQFHSASFKHIYFSIMLFVNHPNLFRFCRFSVNRQLKLKHQLEANSSFHLNRDDIYDFILVLIISIFPLMPAQSFPVMCTHEAFKINYM